MGKIMGVKNESHIYCKLTWYTHKPIRSQNHLQLENGVFDRWDRIQTRKWFSDFPVFRFVILTINGAMKITINKPHRTAVRDEHIT